MRQTAASYDETFEYEAPSKDCGKREFCMRSRDYKYDAQLQQEDNKVSDLQYHVVNELDEIRIKDEEASIEMALNLGCIGSGYLANDLIVKMWFYQNGMTRFLIGEPGNTRFQITQEGISVEWDQLRRVDDLTKKVSIGNE